MGKFLEYLIGVPEWWSTTGKVPRVPRVDGWRGAFPAAICQGKTPCGSWDRKGSQSATALLSSKQTEIQSLDMVVGHAWTISFQKNDKNQIKSRRFFPWRRLKEHHRSPKARWTLSDNWAHLRRALRSPEFQVSTRKLEHQGPKIVQFEAPNFQKWDGYGWLRMVTDGS